MTWKELSTLAALRDETGAIVLEEADDDTRTATFRVYGTRSLTVTIDAAGAVAFDSDAPAVLRRALAPPAIGRWVAAGRQA